MSAVLFMAWLQLSGLVMRVPSSCSSKECCKAQSVLNAEVLCRRYLALVLGRLTGSGVIDHPVGGLAAVTLFQVEGHRPSGEP